MRMLLLLGLSLLSTSIIAQASTSSWCGNSFTDPAHSMQMPADWEKLPMNYPKSARDADLVISFGQQTYPALKPLVEQYARQHNLNIVIQSGTCGISAGKLLRKNIDTGAFCCPAGKSDRLPGLEFHTIAISPLAVIVHKDNPLNNLSLDQARRVFKGKLQKWSELDSRADANKDIITVARLHCKKRPGHWTLLLKDQEHFTPKLKEIGVIPDLIAKVGQTPLSISIETPFMVMLYDKSKTVKQLTLDGHAPSETDYIASGQYPFYRTYNLTTWSNGGNKRDISLALISYLQKHIEENYALYGFVPASKLRENGWQFKGNELIAEPTGKRLSQVHSN
ncbi:MAG: substrate-binding domain-containing protein [Gammaproteobacteria bacterium]|nr:substrate-binding domain-containing protein [Gammaproteobacteria bacterium]